RSHHHHSGRTRRLRTAVTYLFSRPLCFLTAVEASGPESLDREHMDPVFHLVTSPARVEGDPRCEGRSETIAQGDQRRELCSLDVVPCLDLDGDDRSVMAF